MCHLLTSKTQIDNGKDIDIMMPMHDLIEYSDNYSKTSERVWQSLRDEPNDKITESASFKSKIKIKEKIPDNGEKNFFEIALPSQYLSISLRNFELTLTNFEINLILTWSENFVISSATGKKVLEQRIQNVLSQS